MMSNLTQSSVSVTKAQADLLLWCIEQMWIDLSDAEMADLQDVLNQLEGLVRS
jgi:hypothetical protein